MNRARFVVMLVVVASCGAPESVEVLPPPNARNFTLECATRGMRAFDAARALRADVSMTCTAHVGDRLGAQRDVAVDFFSEAGTLTPGRGVASGGEVSFVLAATAPRPVEVPPEVFAFIPNEAPTSTGELLAPLWMLPMRWTENPRVATQVGMATLREPRSMDSLRPGFINNPRDGLVSLIAVVDGEEEFTDENANGTFDVGEVFVDLTEPFVDSNDNATRDDSEFFVDSNGNGTWDGKNGKWDNATRIWASQRVLWTGVPAASDEFVSPATVTMTCASDPCSAAEQQSVLFVIADPWFNALTRLPGEGCSPLVSSLVRVEGFNPGPFAVQETMDPWFSNVRVMDARTMPSARRRPGVPFELSLSCVFDGEQRTMKLVSGTIE